MLYWICLALVVLPLIFERILVARCREKIPLRIHVHGTRGKSSVVRDCARLLREQGLTVLAKTTGDAPEYILPDGKVAPVRRIGPPRIQEHVAILRKAAKLHVEAVVAEGMALAPENVWQSEAILCATHAVITNTRPDHAECMGNGRGGVVRTLGLMIPQDRELLSATEEGGLELLEIASRKNCSATLVNCPSSWHQPGYLANALAGMVLAKKHGPEKGSVPAGRGPEAVELICHDVPLRFLDLFSTNDVESSALLWKERQSGPDWLRVALLATRADRPLRTRDFLEWLLVEEDFDFLLPLGSHAGYVWLRAGHSRRLIKLNPWKDPFCVQKKLVALAALRGKKGVELIGLGNCHGMGKKWRDTLTRMNGYAR